MEFIVYVKCLDCKNYQVLDGSIHYCNQAKRITTPEIVKKCTNKIKDKGVKTMNRDEIEKQIKNLKDEIETEKEQIEATKIYIDNLKLEINALEKKLVKKKPPVVLWKPKDGEEYFVLASFRVLIGHIWTDCEYDNRSYEVGSVFPTLELAELKRDIDLATEEYKRKVAEFNGDWEPNWEDLEQYKCNLTNSVFPTVSKAETYYNPLLEGCYFSMQVRENKEQFEKLKEFYQKIIDLTEEYKEAERKWRNEE